MSNLPVYKVVDVKAVENDEGFLIDIDCDVEPENDLARSIDSQDEFDGTEKIVGVPREINTKCQEIITSYGEKALIE